MNQQQPEAVLTRPTITTSAWFETIIKHVINSKEQQTKHNIHYINNNNKTIVEKHVLKTPNTCTTCCKIWKWTCIRRLLYFLFDQL